MKFKMLSVRLLINVLCVTQEMLSTMTQVINKGLGEHLLLKVKLYHLVEWAKLKEHSVLGRLCKIRTLDKNLEGLKIYWIESQYGKMLNRISDKS